MGPRYVYLCYLVLGLRVPLTGVEEYELQGLAYVNVYDTHFSNFSDSETWQCHCKWLHSHGSVPFIFPLGKLLLNCCKLE